MSAQDAETFVESVRAAMDQVSPGNVIVFVDVHERHTKNDEKSLSEAISDILDDVPPGFRVIRANMHIGDAMVVRVLDVRDVPNGVAGVWANLMDEAVRISGIGASTALVPGGTACLVPIFAYERKTVSDFVSSVIPGRGAPGSVPTTQRWLDQKARLSAFCNASGCLPAMIIEGYMKHAMTGQPLGIMQERHAHAVLHSANRRDGLPFWNSANIHDSARLLVRDAKMVQEDRLLPSGWMRLGTIAGLVQRAADGASSLVIRKSDQATPESWWRAALCLIPGMSANMANAIAADWPSLHHLQRAWAACVSTRQRVAVVADIRYTADKGKGRRIGPVVSERMIERMFKDDADDEPAEDQDEAEREKEKPRKKRKSKSDT